MTDKTSKSGYGICKFCGRDDHVPIPFHTVINPALPAPNDDWLIPTKLSEMSEARIKNRYTPQILALCPCPCHWSKENMNLMLTAINEIFPGSLEEFVKTGRCTVYGEEIV